MAHKNVQRRQPRKLVRRVVVTTLLPEPERDRIRVMATKLNRSVSAYVADAILRTLEKDIESFRK